MDFDFGQISELLENMSPEEMQNLQQMAQSVFSQFGGGEQEPPPPEDSDFDGRDGADAYSANSSGANENMFSPELLAKLAQLMQRMGRRDPRTDLILALKPHLSQRRQARAEQAMQMMKMLELLPTLQEAFRG